METNLPRRMPAPFPLAPTVALTPFYTTWYNVSFPRLLQFILAVCFGAEQRMPPFYWWGKLGNQAWTGNLAGALGAGIIYFIYKYKYIYIYVCILYQLKIGQRPANKAGTAAHWFIFHTDTGLAQSHLLTLLVYWWVVSDRLWWAGLSKNARDIFLSESSRGTVGYISNNPFLHASWSWLLNVDFELGFSGWNSNNGFGWIWKNKRRIINQVI